MGDMLKTFFQITKLILNVLIAKLSIFIVI